MTTPPDTATPIRIQRKRTKGWKMPPNTVSVTRPGKWGNPFDFRKSEYCWAALSYGCKADRLGRQEASVRAYRSWINPGNGRRIVCMSEQSKMGDGRTTIDIGPEIKAGEAPSLEDVRKELKGKNLACFCKIGEPCHADVLLELANGAP